MPKLASFLAFPAAYRCFARMIGGNGSQVYAHEHIQAQPHDRILDIGCGPGDILNYLPPCDYHGVDLSPKYIAAATKRFGDRGTFHCENVTKTSVAQGDFDIVLANGVLHHLDDEEALHLLELAHHALKPDGRLVTIDGCFVPKQSKIAKMLLRMDRGLFIREADEYGRIASQVFDNIDITIRHDLLRLPYTHHIMIAYRSANPKVKPTAA